MFNNFKSSWNACAVNGGSLSERILSGSPNLLKRLFRKSVTAPSQVNVLAQGHKITKGLGIPRPGFDCIPPQVVSLLSSP